MENILVIEYLVIIDKETSPALFRFCDNVKSFKSLFKNETSINFVKDEIHYKEFSPLKYSINIGQVAGKEQRYFYTKIFTSVDGKSLQAIVKFTHAFKKILIECEAQIETLWNDVSLYYAKLAYPYINKSENLMRKLIVYFMLTTIGKDWALETSPKVVKDAIDKGRRTPEQEHIGQEYIGVLYQIDFIHLGDFLFKKYYSRSRSTDDLYRKIESIKKIEDITLEELKSFRQQSNWDKYFSNIVDCKGEKLEKLWTSLYKLRCDIAHNVLIDEKKYNAILTIYIEVSQYLEKALENLHKIEVPIEDREQIIEHVASNFNISYEKFINAWQRLEAILNESSLLPDNSFETMSPTESKIHYMHLNHPEIIDENILKDWLGILEFRNKLVHNSSSALSEAEIEFFIKKIDKIYDLVFLLNKPAAFHAECVTKIEKYTSQNFNKRTRTSYLSNDETTGLVCAVSKTHDRNQQPFYWFAFHLSYKDFLDKTAKGLVAFGCGSENKIILIPYNTFVLDLDHMNTSGKEDRYYWHVHIMQEEDKLFLARRNQEYLDVTPFLITE